jgi:curved DNA-binding protein
LSLEDSYKGTTRILNVDGQRIEVKFKPGIANGQTQKISEKGYPSNAENGKPGDLIIRIKVNEDPKVERKGNDLYTDTECDLYTALLGGNIVATTFFGSFNIKVPPDSPNGKLFKLSNQGMPIYNSEEKEKGSLFVRLCVVLPTNLNEREKELFNQLKNIRS